MLPAPNASSPRCTVAQGIGLLCSSDLSHHRQAHMHPHPMTRRVSAFASSRSFMPRSVPTARIRRRIADPAALPEAGGGPRIRPTSAYNATESGEQDRTPTSADVTRSTGRTRHTRHSPLLTSDRFDSDDDNIGGSVTVTGRLQQSFPPFRWRGKARSGCWRSPDPVTHLMSLVPIAEDQLV